MFKLHKLIVAYLSCRRNKRKTVNALNFETDWENNLLSLQKKLKDHTYCLSRSICFMVTYPKIREVFAAHFKDRVVHHLLVNRIEDFFEKKFIYHSYACRKDKGTHLALFNLQKVLQSIARPTYFLQIDIKSFFCSINKNILFHLLENTLNKTNEFKQSKQEILWLAKIIIFHDPTKSYILKGKKKLFNQLPANKTLFKTPSHKGLPIGNLTSQFFANVYLNELDQFIKRKLKARHYFRYADDMILLSRKKDQLKVWRQEINEFLKQNLDLELNPAKDKVGEIQEGINFVGYIVRPNYILSRNRTVKNLKTKLHYFNQGILLTTENQRQIVLPLANPPPKKVIQNMLAVVNSYYGHLSHANTYKLRKNIYENHFGCLKKYLKPTKNFTLFVIKKT